MRADNSHHLAVAAQRRSAVARQCAERALTQLKERGEPATVAAVCREARVSRSWLYTQTDLIKRTDRHHALTPGTRHAPPSAERASLESTRRRLELALARNRELSEQVRLLRVQLAHAHGRRRAEDVMSPVPATVAPQDA